MKREQLEHVIRASGAVAECRDLVVVGSQAILGAFPEAPAALLASMEADVFPVDHPERADLIDGSIGELSPFHETFGYYAHGIQPDAITLPAGWRGRLVRVENQNTGGVAGWCLSPADLAVSKLAAGRAKDLEFVAAMVTSGLVSPLAIDGVRVELDPAAAALVAERLKPLCPASR